MLSPSLDWDRGLEGKFGRHQKVDLKTYWWTHNEDRHDEQRLFSYRLQPHEPISPTS